MSYLGYPDDAEIDMITIDFRKLPRQTDYLKFKNTLEGTFGDKIHVEEFPLKDAEELMSINSIMLFAVIIGIAMALDTGLLYGYIISRRRKQMAVFGLTGARRIHAVKARRDAWSGWRIRFRKDTYIEKPDRTASKKSFREL